MSDHLHFELHGDPSQRALLLLHGFMSSNLQWTLNFARLGEHFRIVAVELWGHGKSPAPRDPTCYAVDHYLGELERIRVQLDLASWIVCGQSFGAGIAIRYALAEARSVAGLVITNSRSALNDVSRDAGEIGGLETWQALFFYPLRSS